MDCSHPSMDRIIVLSTTQENHYTKNFNRLALQLESIHVSIWPSGSICVPRVRKGRKRWNNSWYTATYCHVRANNNDWLSDPTSVHLGSRWAPNPVTGTFRLDAHAHAH
ncbi:hypothetical protein TMatcc_001567 [Talaromyces marneffei ATCC 18224]